MTADFQLLLQQLEDEGLTNWVAGLRMRQCELETQARHGLWSQWLETIAQLPKHAVTSRRFDLPAVTLSGDITPEDREQLRAAMLTLRPWRKGPFHLFGIDIDTEWRSDWKWDRMSSHVDFKDASVLDVGSGNGYYGWRMLAAGAKRVIGLEPFPLYIAQHQAIHHFERSAQNFVIPGSDADIPKMLDAFDISVSMGVLYHRTSPIDHLQSMFHSLRSGGTLVLETLIVDSPQSTVLVPDGRYAKMRNVWFLPSPSMLERFLNRTGFRNIRIVDITQTTVQEQRQTEWMTFESLTDFLAADGRTTIEGYPLPTRAIVVAEKR